MNRSAFTLMEILVAMVVLEVGLLGVVGTLLVASRTLTRAEALEHGVEMMEGAYDSLSREPAPSHGERLSPWGQLRWTVLGRDAHVALLDLDGDTLVRIEARLPGARAVRP